MNPDRQQAIQYLRGSSAGLWHWAENGGVLVWHDGSTVAFRQELIQIVEWLAPNGLPPFGALVFLLAACRGKLPALEDIPGALDVPPPPGVNPKAALLPSFRFQFRAQLDDARAHLAKVAALPPELNSGLKARCLLAEAVFEPARAERYADARAVLRGWREPIGDAELNGADSADLGARYVRQIHLVAQGLKPHTAGSLALRLRTGLDALPKAAEAGLPAAEQARHLIEDLSRDLELGPLARAARELMAAVRLPRRLGERDQLPLGGVADITNRGPLDRLLLSELAYDDLTLSVRVALNEALYLRREPPLREPPGALALLLDSSVRLWGLPRVLAVALALALIARDRHHSRITAWRSHGKQLQSLDLLSRAGLIDHLTALETTAHPGESLPAFAQAIAGNHQNQSVLITHRDALADPEFRRALANHAPSPAFVAALDRDGHFELHSLPLAHRPPLCHADLDLATIFDESVPVPLLNPEVEPDWPAIFRVSPFPFLMALTGTVNFWVAGTDGLNYAILEDRCLVRFGRPQAGARILADELPGGKSIWMDCDGSQVQAIKSGSSQRPARLLSLALPCGELRVTDLISGEEVQSAYRYGEAIVLVRPHDVRAYSLADGRLLSQALNPHLWVNGRFFRGTNRFYFVVWDGERVKFEPVSIPSAYLAGSIATVFDRHGLEGPWLLTRTGHLVASESGQMVQLPREVEGRSLNFNVPLVSRDGHRLYVPAAGGSTPPARGCLFHLNLGTHDSAVSPKLAGRLLNCHPPLPIWNIYRSVHSLALADNALALSNRKNQWRKLALDEQGILRITNPPAFLSRLPPYKFSDPPHKTRHGCTLRAAELPNGSRVLLDSRGLLHFKSRQPHLPEVSLLLAQGEVAGWTSDGCVCGPAFFFEQPVSSNPAGVFQRLMNITQS